MPIVKVGDKTVSFPEGMSLEQINAILRGDANSTIAARILSGGQQESSRFARENTGANDLLRDPYQSEIDYFNSNHNVAGMATEDNKIIMNPNFKGSDMERNAVIQNEEARIYMRTNNPPTFDITEDQQSRFSTYGSPVDIRSTIAARILSGDPSAGDATEEQRMFVGGLRKEIGQYNQGQQRVPNLKDRLMAAVTVATPEESAKYFSKGANDSRWGETLKGEDSPTSRTTIMINDAKFKASGVGEAYRDKAILGELLHSLSDVDPERYQRLLGSADNPEMNRWAQESYRNVTDPAQNPDYVESRPFDEWYKKSRFDQVMGGYLQAGDPDLPTMKTWSQSLPFGDGFKKELELLRRELQ